MRKVKLMDKSIEELLLSGAIIVSVGTLSTAFGQTNVTLTSSEQWKSFIVKGNGIEAFGNSLQGIARSKESIPNQWNRFMSIAGSWFQAGGNVTNSVGTTIELVNGVKEGRQLNIIGSGIQSVGAFLEGNALLNQRTDLSTQIETEALGYTIISFGALLDTIGFLWVLSGNEGIGNNILLVASWTQAIGAIVVIIGLIE